MAKKVPGTFRSQRYQVPFAFLAALIASQARADGVGSAAADFLNIAASTRAAGMGEAFVGVADDAGALYYNPGGLIRNRDMNLHYLHAFWLQSVGYDYLSAISPFGKFGTGGVSFTRLFAQGEKIVVGPSGEPVKQGNFTASDSAVVAGWAYPISPAASAGATVKMLNQDLSIASASAVAADLGVLYKTPVAQLTSGVVLSNLGPALDHSALPVTLKLGTGYTLPPLRGVAAWRGIKGLWDVPLLTADMHFMLSPQQPNLIRIRLGAEYQMAIDAGQTAAVRLGYKFGEDGSGGLQGATFGLGYRVTSGRFMLGVDYALVHYGDLGLTHRLAFTTSFLHLSEVSFASVAEDAKASKREGQVHIEWPASSDPQVSGYNVYMGESKDADFVKVNRTGALTGTSLSLRGLKIGKTYFFFVTSIVGVEPAIEGRPFFETSAQAQPVP